MVGVPGDARREALLPAEPHVPVDEVLAGLVRPGGLVQRAERPERAVPAGIAVVAALRPGDLADAAALDDLAGLPELVLGGEVGADLEDLPVLPDGVPHLDGLLHREGHGLFAVDMLSGVHGGDGDGGMPVVRRGDEDRVDVLVVEKFAVVEATFGLVTRLLAGGERAVHPLLIDVTDAPDGDVVVLAPAEKAAQMPRTHAADADHAETYAVVGPEHLRGDETAERERSGGRRRGPEERPAG